MFESAVQRAGTLLAANRPGDAASLLGMALAMWAGPALADIPKGRHLDVHVFHLEERRMQALELSIQAGFALGRCRELVGELRSLTILYPLNEWFHGRLMAALADCGRRSEALQAYHNLRQLPLGLHPSEEIERMQNRILNEHPHLTGSVGPADP